MRQYLISTIRLAMALALAAAGAQAQSERTPWQGTYTKSFHPVGASRIFVDLPMPAEGRVLTVEGVGVMIGPTGSAYGKVKWCEIESGRPHPVAHELAENRTRALLPLPALVYPGSKVWGIPQTPLRIYAEREELGLRNLFRVVCEVENIAPNDSMTVTVAGYTTAK